MKTKIFWMLIFLLVFSAGIAAQVTQPQAALRLAEKCRKNDGVVDSTANKIKNCYMVEIYMPEGLDFEKYGMKPERDCKDADRKKIDCPAPKFARIFNGKPLENPVVISPNEHFLNENLQEDKYPKIALPHLFAIYLSDTFDPNTSLQIIFDPYKTKNSELRFLPITVTKDFKVDFSYNNYNNVIYQTIEFNKDPLKCGDIDTTQKAFEKADAMYKSDPKSENLDNKNDANEIAEFAKVCNADLVRLHDNYIEYKDNRLAALGKWFSFDPKNKKELEEKYKLLVENLNKCKTVPPDIKAPPNSKPRGCMSFNEWADFASQLEAPDTKDKNHQERAVIYHKFLTGKIDKLPNISTPPTDDDYIIMANLIYNLDDLAREKFLKDRNLQEDNLDKFTVTDVKTFPITNQQLTADRRILAEYHFKQSVPTKFSMLLSYTPSAPFEIAKKFNVTAKELTEVTVNTKEDTGTVGERTRPNRLDAAFQFGSSVDEKEKEVNGVKTKIPERTTRGTLDLRASFFPTQTNYKWFSWEPLFVDAKVSNGKITKDTLSINRIVVGTSLDFTKTVKNKNGFSPNYYTFNLKPVQASDRDFKQLEYKLIGEFQPIISFLNHIPANFRSTVNRVISKEGDLPTRFVAPAWGYKILPVFGGEIGKTWLRRKPAEAIESTDFIRRLYTGIDMTFYIPGNMSLSIYDKFYWNFGKDKKGNEVDGQENYFKTSLDIGIRKRNEMGDSIFISFEKGNEPPFGPRDKNIFKIGYRVVNPKFLRPW